MVTLGALFACTGVSDYLPKGPPLSDDAQARWLVESTASSGQAPPADDRAPVPPLQVFAAHYVEDIVLESKGTPWSMHEYARVRLGDRELWVAKDSDADGVQTITADVEDLARWLPEVPVPRRRGPVEVEDRSDAEHLDVTIRYTNPRGVRTAVDFRAPREGALESKRNGSTFDHSRQAVSVLLDVRRRIRSDVEATIAFDGEPTRIRRVLGLVPVKALLEQTQAGFAAASMAVRTSSAGLDVVRPAPGTPWPTASEERWRWDGAAGTGVLHYAAFGAEHRLRFEGGGLVEAQIDLAGLDASGLRCRLSAPLPDLTRPFAEEVIRNFTCDVGGQPHGHGRMRARWEEGVGVLEIEPVAPRWFAERPVRSRLTPQPDGSVVVESRVLDPKTGKPLAVVR